MPSFLRYLKKASKLKGKGKAPAEKGEQIDKSIYRVGIFGHNDVGKTVFLTSAYAFSKDSPDLQLLAMGDTQAYLEENFNLMKGTGSDRITREKIETRKFPDSTSAEKKLSFSAQIGKTVNVSLETLDYSGRNIYIDSPAGMPKDLLEFFQLCDCILFFIDPNAINNEGEFTRRVASFTQLIKQLTGTGKKLKIPVGLVITKADELPGFKSGLQSILVRNGFGYVKALRFNDFLNGVVKQQYLADYPEWKETLKSMLSRFRSFFSPLIKSTLDYQVFFVSSTGSPPQPMAGEAGNKTGSPPKDFRPLGVSRPIEWALRRIRARRRAYVLNAVLKWFIFASLFAVLLVGFANVYNIKKINSLVNKVSSLKLDRLDAYGELASAFNGYSNNFIIKLFFGDFRRVSQDQYGHFAGISGDDWMRAQFEQFNLMKDSAVVLVNAVEDPGTDSASYAVSVSNLNNLLSMAEDLERSVRTQGYSTAWMESDLSQWRETLNNMPTAEDHAAVSKLIGEFDDLKQDFTDNIDQKNYVYLLDTGDNSQFPGQLTELKGKLDAYNKVPGVDRYSQKIDNYLNQVTQLEKKGDYIYFTVSGANPSSNGYYITFTPQPGFPEGAIDASSRERIRIPAKQDIEIKLFDVNKGVAVDNCIIPAGYDSKTSASMSNCVSISMILNRR
jgi:hypothetical protein